MESYVYKEHQNSEISIKTGPGRLYKFVTNGPIYARNLYTVLIPVSVAKKEGGGGGGVVHTNLYIFVYKFLVIGTRSSKIKKTNLQPKELFSNQTRKKIIQGTERAGKVAPVPNHNNN